MGASPCSAVSLVRAALLCGVVSAALMAPAAAALEFKNGFLSTWAKGCTFAGTPIGDLPTKTASACMELCLTTTGCTHWSFDNDIDQCFVRGGKVQQSDAVDKDNWYCGVMHWVNA